jgi:hypothetical protein
MPAFNLLLVYILIIDGGEKLTTVLSFPLIPKVNGHLAMEENILETSKVIA